MMDKIANVLGMIVVLGIVTTVVARPSSAGVIRAAGESFSGAIRAAMGN